MTIPGSARGGLCSKLRTSWKQLSIEIGLTLAQAFQTRKISFNARSDRLMVPYRDDNRYLWALPKADLSPQELPDSFFELKLLLGNNELASADEDSKPLPKEKPPARVPVSASYVYSEWDYRSQVETASWVTIRDANSKPGDLEIIANIVNAEHGSGVAHEESSPCRPVQRCAPHQETRGRRRNRRRCRDPRPDRYQVGGAAGYPGS